MTNEEKEKKLIRKGLNTIPKNELIEFLLIFYMQPPRTINDTLEWIKSFQVGLGTLITKHLTK